MLRRARYFDSVTLSERRSSHRSLALVGLLSTGLACTSGTDSDTSSSSSAEEGSTTATDSASSEATDTEESSDGSATTQAETSAGDGDGDGDSTSGDGDGDGDPDACGYQDQGTRTIIGDDIELCLPPTICNLETCPADLGTCVGGLEGECVFHEGYEGLATLPEAWATWYCDLETGCLGTLEYVTWDVRDQVRDYLEIPTCYEDSSGTCLGIVAFSPMMGGNSRLAKNAEGGALAEWGLGLTPATGECYEVTGKTGKKAVVAVTDRCAGYCACDEAREEFQECGNCLLSVGQEPDAVTPGCPCVGDIAAMGDAGLACPGEQTCDWCMSNNHPHFDFDLHTFNHLCDDEAIQGSCELASVRIVECMEPTTWPCPTGSWFCFGDNPAGRIAGTYCCQ